MARRIIFLLVAILIGVYYRWTARASGGDFLWGYDRLDGYYNFLSRAFAEGHLYLEMRPSPELLAQPDPWDPNVPLSMKWHDMVLYGGRYYLYFGAAPAALVFLPYRLATGRDMPQNYGLFLICYAAFLFSCGALVRMLELAGVDPPLWLFTLALLALGVCSGAAFLLNRALHYEIAIGGGCLFLSAGIFCLAQAIGRRSAVWWLGASGLMFGLATGSRPHLVFAGLCAAGVLAWRRGRKDAAAFLAGLALVGAAIGWYNYERFGNAFQFGFRYQLSGPGMNRLGITPANVVPGVYYTLLAKPVLTSVFPWFRMVFRFPFDNPTYALPPEYFIEPSVGALWLAPWILAAVWIKRRKEPRTGLLTATLSSGAILLFLIWTHLSSQRYEADFVPPAILAALVNICFLVHESSGRKRAAIAGAACVLLIYSMVANAAMGFSGPYDDILRNRPQSYVRIARRFSFGREYRPLLNPKIALEFVAVPFRESEGYAEPLVVTGHAHLQYFLYLEHHQGRVRLVSQYEEAKAEYDVEGPETARLAIRVAYSPEQRRMVVDVNGRQAIAQDAPVLVTAPTEVAIGCDPSLSYVTARNFTGRIQVLQKIVE